MASSLQPMQSLLAEERFDFVSAGDKAFILALDAEMERLGYSAGGRIGSGFCWGRYMVVYTKAGVKSKRVYARIYLTDKWPVLRLFLSDIDKHRAFIESSPDWMKEVFVGPAGTCKHCGNERDGACQFRKVYTLHQRRIEKCNGSTFRFDRPSAERLPQYIALFTEFYPPRSGAYCRRSTQARPARVLR